MGGKANCLCLRGIWETPKPRYREETKPVMQVAWGHFFATPDVGRRSAAQPFAGISFLGSRNGIGVTVAVIVPSGESISSRLPAVAWSIGTHA
jgi:hypothetical protein